MLYKNQEKPIVFLDLETTELNPLEARIVSLCFIKVHPNGKIEEKVRMINPGKPIDPGATEVHGITDEDVKNCPKFRALSKSLHMFLQDCDIAGFNNNRYDNHVLFQEFHRCGINFPDASVRSIDVMPIFHAMEPRDLSAAYRFYTGNELQGAHDAKNDAYAALEIFKGQMKKHKVLGDNGIDFLQSFSKKNPASVDWAGYIIKKSDGECYLVVGGKSETAIRGKEKTFNWFLQSDKFPQQSKNCLMQIINEYMVEKVRVPSLLPTEINDADTMPEKRKKKRAKKQ